MFSLTIASHVLIVLLLGNAIKSKDVISKSVDKAMDKAQPASNGAVGISIRNGPVEEMDIDQPQVNGTKRKARASTSKSYKEDSDGSEDAPLVRVVTHFTTYLQI